MNGMDKFDIERLYLDYRDEGGVGRFRLEIDRGDGQGLITMDRFQEALDVANLLARLSDDMRGVSARVGESGKTITELIDQHRARQKA